MMSDVIQSGGLTIYAEVGLVILFLAFLFAVARTLTRKREHYEQLAKIPLEDDESSSPREGSSTEPSEV